MKVDLARPSFSTVAGGGTVLPPEFLADGDTITRDCVIDTTDATREVVIDGETFTEARVTLAAPTNDSVPIRMTTIGPHTAVIAGPVNGDTIRVIDAEVTTILVPRGSQWRIPTGAIWAPPAAVPAGALPDRYATTITGAVTPGVFILTSEASTGSLVQWSVQAGSGTGTAQLRIDGLNVGSAVNVTTTKATTAITGQSLAAGALIEIELTGSLTDVSMAVDASTTSLTQRPSIYVDGGVENKLYLVEFDTQASGQVTRITADLVSGSCTVAVVVNDVTDAGALNVTTTESSATLAIAASAGSRIQLLVSNVSVDATGLSATVEIT